MANLQKKSLDQLLRIDAGITDLFSSGINDLQAITKEQAYNLFNVLMLQSEVQEEIRERILKVIPLPELELAPSDE